MPRQQRLQVAPAAPPVAVAGEGDERGQQHVLEAESQQRGVRLPVVGAGEQREVEQLRGRPRAVIRPAWGERHDVSEHLLHCQGRANLDAHASLVVARVGKRVRGARLDEDDVAWAGDHAAAADAEARWRGCHQAPGRHHRHPGHPLVDRHRPGGPQRLGSARCANPHIGRAIALTHNDPARPWTVAALAAELAMSRSAFAARFTELVGGPAMQYVIT